MANPVKYSGVEDVLTSIRRLVSEDAGRRHVSQAAVERAQNGSPDRLVLTAALRVSESGAPACAPADAAAGDPPPGKSSDSTLREMQAAPGEPPDGAAAKHASGEASGEDAPPDDAFSGGTFRDPPAADPYAALEEKRLAAAQTDDPETPDDPGAPDRESGPEAATDEDADASASAILRERRLHLAAPTASGYYENEHAVERSSGAGRKLAGCADAEGDMAASGAGDGAWIGAGVAGSTGGGDGDAARPDEPEACQPEDVAPEERFRLFDGETALVDEQMLHDMVVDVVREELQGELGERITRNVRKLVRREVFRALATRDFE